MKSFALKPEGASPGRKSADPGHKPRDAQDTAPDPAFAWNFGDISVHCSGRPPARPVERLLGSPGKPFGTGEVRIHTDRAAAESAQSMRARAYTYGQNIVFNRGEFDPTSARGRALIAHELEHTARQASPSNYRLEFQKQAATPEKFYKEVEDALAELGNRTYLGPDKDYSYLSDLLDLSKAVEAQNKGDTKQLTAKVVAATPFSGMPVARSETFVNELVARTLLMGLDSEANQLRGFFRALARSPMQRNPTDTKFGADKDLWTLLVTKTIEQAKFGNAAEAAASIDSLLATFRIICNEARKINFEDVLRDRKANYGTFITDPYSTPDTLDSYFSSLIGQLRALTVPIFHGVESMMEAAVADLEADKGGAALAAAKAVLDGKVQPVFNLTIGDQNLLNITVDATRSTFGPKQGKHHDYFDTSKAGEKRSVTIDYFDKTQTTGFNEKTNPVGYIILAQKKKIAFVEKFYVAENRAAMGAKPLKLESVDDWRKFLHEKVLEEQKKGKKDDEVLTTVVGFLSDYLQAFTTSTPFNIEDVIKQDSENYNKRQLPRAITGQLIEDCGVYALRTVYMLSLVKFDLKLRIRFIYLPSHVGLIITGDGLQTLIAHNNKIYPIDAATLAKEKTDWAKKDPSKPTSDDQFIGEVAGSYYSPGVDTPFRLDEAPAIAKNDPREKEKLQDYFTKNSQPGKDVLADAPKAGITQFHLEYLRLNDEAKKMYNNVVVPTWNGPLREAWNRHKDRLLAELAKARAGESKVAYDVESKAYLADLDAALKPVTDAAAVVDKSRQDVSTTLGANPELTARGATRGFGRRVSFTFFWEDSLATHRAAVSDSSNLKDPAKPDQITPSFGKAEGFLQPIY